MGPPNPAHERAFREIVKTISQTSTDLNTFPPPNLFTRDRGRANPVHESASNGICVRALGLDDLRDDLRVVATCYRATDLPYVGSTWGCKEDRESDADGPFNVAPRYCYPMRLTAAPRHKRRFAPPAATAHG